MKTAIIEMAQSAPWFIRNAWAKVLRSSGWQVIDWWSEKTAAFDAFSSVETVDLFIGTTYNFDRALDKIVRQRPQMKVALFASAWGDLTDNIDSVEYPIVKICEQEKSILGKLRQDIGKPDLVFIHITERHLEGSLGKWKSELGIPIMGLLNGADLFTYYGAQPEQKYAADVSFVGGHWPYKAKTLDKYIGRLCDEELMNLNIKIYGSGWQKPQFLGSVNIGEDAKIFASSTIYPCISEAHSYIIDDVVERAFKVPCAEGFLICDNVNLDEVYPKDTVPQFSSYEEFRELINFYLKKENQMKRVGLIHRQKYHVVMNHSYHERMHKLLTNLELHDDAKLVLEQKRKYFKLGSELGD